MSLPPKRPKLALRIGISGLRNLDPAQVPRLSAQVGAVLFAAKQEMEDLAKQETTAAVYDPHKPDGKLEPWLRFLSPLARGSDRLGAWEALELGYDMHVPMPFPQHDYELDFDTPDDLDEFHKLFPSDGDKWLALDGDRELDSNRAYVDKRRKFASQHLGNEAGAIATLMLQDLEGWAQLFRVKGIEPS